MSRLVAGGLLIPVLACACAVLAQAEDPERRVLFPKPVRLESVSTMHVTSLGQVTSSTPVMPFDDCNGVSTHTDADFTGGTYNLQGGFAEHEILAASYELPASSFPIRIDLLETLIATSNASVATTTKWSVIVWDGPPNTGEIVAEYSSDGVILPHVDLPPGENGVNLQFAIDPGDPSQIVVLNNSGTNTFTVGWRIDEHNNQTSNPCVSAPPSNSNAFPATDLGGLAAPTKNWLMALNCGPIGCPPNGGWTTFQGLDPTFCRPSGDWMIRATWTSLTCNPDVGACCRANGTCDQTLATDCDGPGETFHGAGSDCGSVVCTIPTQACCFQATSGCLELTEGDCIAAGGVPQGLGTECASTVCFPVGAVCMPDGTCRDGLTPDDAVALGGVFQGDGTTCATTVCPEPTGASCFPNGFCLQLTEAQAIAAGAVWGGPGTTCAGDSNNNGIDDFCETPACPADLTGEGDVNTNDFFQFLAYYQAMDSRADFAPGGGINTNDFFAYLAAYQAGC